MRKEFSENTKRTLAQRVAYRCSFPGCGRITIGPGTESHEQVINLGEAAHIYAASEKGPRSNPALSAEEIVSIENGIWLCRSHARIIDADQINYSAETLIQWKQLAEQRTYLNLQNMDRGKAVSAQTLISLTSRLVFSGSWLAVFEDTWRFEVDHFVEGDLAALRAFTINFEEIEPWQRFVAVESQGDGRQLKAVGWNAAADGKFEFSCQVSPKSQRIDPDQFGSDLGLGDDFDLEIKDGDFTTVKGVDCALQTIRVILSSCFGDFLGTPAEGSEFSRYYEDYQKDPGLLNRLLKLEIIRLLSVEIPDHQRGKNSTPFDFINRVLDVRITENLPKEQTAIIWLCLEWGNGKIWEGTLRLKPHKIFQQDPVSDEDILRNLLREGDISPFN